MLKNTKEAFDKIKRDISVIKWIFTYGFNILLMLYLTCALVFNLGNFIANVVLMVICVLSLIFNIIYGKSELSKKEKKVQKRKLSRAKLYLNAIKIIVKAYSLVVVLYGMYVATIAVSPLSIIFTTLLIVVWVVDFAIEILKILFDIERTRLESAISEDFEWLNKIKEFFETQTKNVKNVAGKVGETINKVFHKDSESQNNKKTKDKIS